MTIEKLKSGSYRITQIENKVRYRVTVDHKPTQSEALQLLYEKMQKPPDGKMDLKGACSQYINNRKNVLSPSTITSYREIIRKIPPKYGNIKLYDIDSETIQGIANEFAESKSPKTVKNRVSFIMSVLSANDIRIKEPTLPQMKKNRDYIPTKDDVSKVFKALQGSKYEIPIMLAAMGLRRSEICALTMDDLDGNRLTVDKAKVIDENNNYVIKSTKTTASERIIILPDNLCQLIREQGEIYTGHPGNILKNLKLAQQKAGVPEFKLHKLRHFFCSYMIDQGFTDAQVQEAGGWRDGSRVMKAVYEHAMNMADAKKDMANAIGNL